MRSPTANIRSMVGFETRPVLLLFSNGKRARLFLSVMMLLLGMQIPVEITLSAEGKPPWQAEWDKTVAAAKKEGRLNFYVGRYGSEKLLNEFRKEFPEIKLVTTNGAGNSLGTRIVAEARSGSMVADL